MDSRFFLMILYLWMVVQFESFRCLGCTDQERTALLNLKAVFNYPNGSSLASWDTNNNQTSDCCMWEGVVCNGTTSSRRRVVQLFFNHTRDYQLPDEFREWYINASLFLPFEELRLLDLSYNYLLGWIHNEGFNKLSRLNKLQRLNLNWNDIRNLTSLGELSSLKALYLRGNKLEGTIPIDEFTSLRKLEVLDLGDNGFNGSIPSSVGSLTSLKALSLGNNGLNGSLPIQGLCNLKNLQELDLSDNGFDGNLPACLGNLTSLRLLDVSHNQFGGDFPSSSILGLTSLEYISLSYNQFEGLIQLSLFANNSKLEAFELVSQNNQLVVETEYPPWVPRFQLKSLTLSNCALRNPSGAIPSFLSTQYDLREVDLSHNNLKGKFPTWILENNTRLGFLNLMNNSFTGPLPSHSNYTDMSVFDISMNHIQAELPLNIGIIFPNLRILNFSRNSLQGSIPPSLGGMDSLLSLDLSKNNFSGKVPDEIGNFSNLKTLVMSRNFFDGPIPIDFCQLYDLRFLDFSQNNLYGAIPSCLDLPYLKYIHLQKNGFTGSIPNALAKSSNLVTLDARDNNLSGNIPTWINALSNLRVLLLKGNRLQGPIPFQFCQLSKLSIVDLSHNNLSGTIPSCLNNISFGRVEVMDDNAFFSRPYQLIGGITSEVYGILLIANYFRSTVYTTYDEQEEVVFITKSRAESYKGNILYFMSGLDLSGNALTGHIPSEIGDLSGIHSLNLSNNCLIGSIPESFSNLKQVESLDLSYNRLRGAIPPQLTGLTFLAVFTVAHNNLSGKTPDMKNQFATFEEISYEGNPLLCGPPLNKSCNNTKMQPLIPRPSNAGVNDTNTLTSFYISFAVSYIIGLWGYIALLYFNSRWREMIFSYINTFIDSFHHRFIW